MGKGARLTPGTYEYLSNDGSNVDAGGDVGGCSGLNGAASSPRKRCVHVLILGTCECDLT